MNASLGVIVLVVTVGVVGCFHPRGHDVKLGPLSVLVRDRNTKEPVQGVRVDVSLEAIRTRGKFLGIVPSVEPDIGPFVMASSSAVTDAEGKAKFLERTLWLRGDAYLDRLLVFANVIPKPGDGGVKEALRVVKSKCERLPWGCAEEVIQSELMRLLMTAHWGAVLDYYIENPIGEYGGVVRFSEMSGRPKGGARRTPKAGLCVEWMEPSALAGVDIVVDLPRREP